MFHSRSNQDEILLSIYAPSRARQVLGSHFYGELTKTEEGCQLLRAKGHFSDYARYIREHCAESKDPNTIGELKSILWAVVRRRVWISKAGGFELFD